MTALIVCYIFITISVLLEGRRTPHMNSQQPLSMLSPGRVARSVGYLTRKSEVLGSIPGLATYFRSFFLRYFKQGSCQLMAKVCA